MRQFTQGGGGNLRKNFRVFLDLVQLGQVCSVPEEKSTGTDLCQAQSKGLLSEPGEKGNEVSGLVFSILSLFLSVLRGGQVIASGRLSDTAQSITIGAC